MLIRERREDLGMSLKGLAGDIGVSSAVLSRWERGLQPIPDERFRQIAERLEMDDALADDEDGRVTLERLDEWRDLVWTDDALIESQPNVMLVLLWISRKAREVDGLAAYIGGASGASRLVRNLTAEQVGDAWPHVMRSSYVVQDADGVVFFKLPAQH